MSQFIYRFLDFFESWIMFVTHYACKLYLRIKILFFNLDGVMKTVGGAKIP